MSENVIADDMQIFIDANQEIIDAVIVATNPSAWGIDDERETWVLNDEYLYTLAQVAGVDV